MKARKRFEYKVGEFDEEELARLQGNSGNYLVGVEALQGETTDMGKEVHIKFGGSVMKVVFDRAVK